MAHGKRPRRAVSAPSASRPVDQVVAIARCRLRTSLRDWPTPSRIPLRLTATTSPSNEYFSYRRQSWPARHRTTFSILDFVNLGPRGASIFTTLRHSILRCSTTAGAPSRPSLMRATLAYREYRFLPSLRVSTSRPFDRAASCGRVMENTNVRRQIPHARGSVYTIPWRGDSRHAAELARDATWACIR